MVCSSSTCKCSSTNYWNGTYCSSIGTYGSTCKIEIGCDTSKLLNCTVTGQNLYICDCLPTYFWSTSSNTCTAKYSNGINCVNSTECRTDLGLSCSTSSTPYTCSCASNYYWSTSGATPTCGIIK